nr:hypothetical protein [Tanacetum cinerariifolium]
MAESSSQKTSSSKIIPKEEPVTLDKPESPNPFLPANQVDFTFDEITFTTNNEVALLYPLHPNQDYFEVVSDFISKCFLKEAFTRALNQYKEYLSEVSYIAKTLDDSKVWISSPAGGIRGDMGITTFRNALRSQYLPYLSMYVPPPSITTVRPWFAIIRYMGEIKEKGILKKELPSFQMEVADGSNHAVFSSAKDKSPGHPSPPTPVVGEMHKEAQQAASGLTSLRATNEEGAHPQLSSGFHPFFTTTSFFKKKKASKKERKAYDQ